MKALRYIQPGQAAVTTVDQPVLNDDEVLIKVHAAGICGTDISIIGGNHPRARPGLVLGHEFAGEVVDIRTRRETPGIEVGQRATVLPLLFCGTCWACTHGCEHVCRTLRMTGIDEDGGLADYVKIPLDLTYRLPDDLPYEKGALVEPLAVGLHAVAMGRVRPTDNVLVMGAGPIGLFVALALRARAVERITILDVQPYRLRLAQSLGFSVLDGSAASIEADLTSLTDGEGADVLFECAGSASAAMQMAQVTRSRGTIVLVSVHKLAHEVDLRAINFKEITLIGSRVYDRAAYDEAIAMAGEAPLLELVSHRFSLADAAEAVALSRQGGEVCKLLVTMD